MDSKEFAEILVEELVDNDPPDSKRWMRASGINPDNLDDADEIWKLFVRFNLESLGMKAQIVWNHYETIPDDSYLKQRQKLLDSIKPLEGLKCYENFSHECSMIFKGGSFYNKEMCYNNGNFDECPVVKLTNELKWHKAHYRIAKIIVETAKRLLIENENGKKNGNFNDIVNSIAEKYVDTDDRWKQKATKELLEQFNGIKWYGSPSKVVVWFFRELSSPFMQVNHFKNLDLWQFIPIDTHVEDLSNLFGFLSTNRDIRTVLPELYPEEPGKLDFALYKLGGEAEKNICNKNKRDCKSCKGELPKIYENCPSDDKRKF